MEYTIGVISLNLFVIALAICRVGEQIAKAIRETRDEQ